MKILKNSYHMEILKAQFSRVFFVGAVFLYLGAVFTIIAFASPYWSQCDPDKCHQNPLEKNKNPPNQKIFPKFLNIGLWQVSDHYNDVDIFGYELNH